MEVAQMGRPVVIVGAADVTEDYKTSEKDAMELAAEAALKAVEGAGKEPGILREADGVLTIPPGHVTVEYSIGVSQKLGMANETYYSSTSGGSSPVELVNLAAKLIGTGWHEFLVIASGDNIGSHRRTNFNVYMSAIQLLFTSLYTKREADHGLNLPAPSYAMYGIAHAAKRGYTIEELQRAYAEMIAAFSRVASGYPPAKSKEVVTAEEVLKSPPVALPFTMLMCANPRVDQGNALLVMSEEKAKALGIGEERWVYVHGGGDFTDHKSTEDEKEFAEMLPARIAILRALARAGIRLERVGDEIRHFDIYSCFPSVVNYVTGALGMEFRDYERFTLTGGLPRRGGAGSLYSMSALAAMYERLARDGGKGLVYGIGGASSAHGAVVLGKERRDTVVGAASSPELAEAMRAHAAVPRATLDPNPSGRARIVTYTVIYENRLRGKDIEPYAVCIGRGSGGQFTANIDGVEPREIAAMKPSDVVGRECRVETSGKGITRMYW
ncbi:MAG: hypothetical protein AB1742_01165 [bacterium]